MRLRRADLNDDGVFKYYPLMDYIEDIDTNQIINEYVDLRLKCFSPEVALFMRPSSKRYGYENRAIGKSQFSKMTCHVAELLGKPNPAAYTLHTIRHPSLGYWRMAVFLRRNWESSEDGRESKHR